MKEERSEWWKGIAYLAVLAGLAIGLSLLFRGQRPPPVATEAAATATATCTPTPTMPPPPTATPGPRHLSAAVEVQVQNPEGFGPMHLCGDTMVGDTLINGEQQLVTLDLTTGEMRQVSSAPGTRVKYFARISESWVVWIEVVGSADNWPERHLKAYDRETGREYTVEANTTYELDLSGDVVVWEERVNDNNVFAQNLRTGQRWTIAERPGAQRYPRISGSWVVYVDLAEHASKEQVADLWAYNLETGEDSMLGKVVYPKDASRGTHHAISDGLVVWAAPSGEFDPPHRLMGLDLNTPGAQPFLIMSGYFDSLKLFDGILVYGYGRGRTLYDLQRKEQLAFLDRTTDLVISGDRVVWWGPELFYTARIEP